MSEGQSAWAENHRKDFETSRAAFEARSDFAAVVAEAKQRGFRRISMLSRWKQDRPMRTHGVAVFG